MIKKKYIVSGTYEEYNEFVYKRRNEVNTSYVYVQHATQLVGLSNIEGFYIGTYFKRPDIDDIRERIALSKRIKANDKDISYTNEYSVELVQQLDNNHVVDYKVNRLFSG